jgi:hypothetical protein
MAEHEGSAANVARRVEEALGGCVPEVVDADRACATLVDPRRRCRVVPVRAQRRLVLAEQETLAARERGGAAREQLRQARRQRQRALVLLLVDGRRDE